LGTSLKHLVNSLTELAALGVAFVGVRDNLDLSTPSGRLMFLLGQPRIPVQAKRQLLKRSENAMRLPIEAGFGSRMYLRSAPLVDLVLTAERCRINDFQHRPRRRLWKAAGILNVIADRFPCSLLCSNRKRGNYIWFSNRRTLVSEGKDVQQGTLALMVLKTLESMGSLHGYGIARRIEQTSGDLLSVNYGTLYPALLKLEQEGYIASEWGVSDNNRRARYYRLTRAGKKQVEREAREWNETAAIVARFLNPEESR